MSELCQADKARLGSARVALLVNFIDPEKVSGLEILEEALGEFTIFISTEREGHRIWSPRVGRLKTVRQRTLTIRSAWRHPMGFKDINYLHFPLDTLAQLRRYRPDIIVSSQLGLRTLLACLFRIFHAEARLVVSVQMTEHQQSGRRPFRVLARKFIRRFADAVVANGHSARRLMEGLGFQPEKIFIAPGCVDTGRFLALPTRATVGDPRRFLYVGRLVEGKGLLPFLARLCRFAHRNPDKRLVFDAVGYGPLETTIARMERPRNLEIRSGGPALPEMLPQVYASGDVFVLPTLSDEWGMVINEAMASGLPILGSLYSQAVQELVTEGINGWLFTPDRQNEIDQAIARAVHAPDPQILAMGRDAREAIRKLTPAQWASDVLAALGSVL